MSLVRLRFVLLLALVPAGNAGASSIDFDATSPGTLPAGWASAQTRSGAAPRWQVLADPTAPSRPNVLAQLSQDRTAGRFPLAIYQPVTIRDGELSVRFKPVSGQVDQAAGLVWRYRDAGNYYLVRANALENNVVLYKVENGERTSIPPEDRASRSYGVKHVVPSRTWSELKVVFSGAAATVYLNGERLFATHDNTFLAPGKIGLWTKADSVTYFDHFSFTGK